MVNAFVVRDEKFETHARRLFPPIGSPAVLPLAFPGLAVPTVGRTVFVEFSAVLLTTYDNTCAPFVKLCAPFVPNQAQKTPIAPIRAFTYVRQVLHALSRHTYTNQYARTRFRPSGLLVGYYNIQFFRRTFTEGDS